jgi:hypothetical protein
MKHLVALLLSFTLILGAAVSPQTGIAAPSDNHCAMKAAASCSRCSCCVKSGGDQGVPIRDAVPAPDSTVRWHVIASLLPVLQPVPLDSLPPSNAPSVQVPSPQSVPLYQRHCLLLI